ncbi:hypothetical protein VTO73DRAFT_13096 [Trametes versicolor]
MSRIKHYVQILCYSARIAFKPTGKLAPKPPTLCERCWKGPFAAQLGLFHHEGYSYFVWRSQVKQGASSGCLWCKLLLDECLLVQDWPKKTKPQCRKITLTSCRSQGLVEFGVQMLQVLVSNCSVPSGYFLTTSFDNPATPYITAHEPILAVGSSRALSLAKALIDECVHGHERCKHISASSHEARLPTRLLDCTNPALPRLVSTEGEHGQYIALSYVWGGAQPHKTTVSNKSVYSAGIDASLLPQTIRDAIYVTHTLGFQYLWVDSLCIIQDSDEDKLHEIGRMHLIYRHAYLAIIAASAERVSDGFLQDRPAPLHGDETSRVKQPVAGGEVRLSRFGPSHWASPSDPTEPVDRRGWCLQELLMSSRALIFTSTTLDFRCQNTTLTVGNSFDTGRRLRYVQLPDIVLLPAPPLVQPGSRHWNDAHDEWVGVVKKYSPLTLGQASDKLVACGALAEAFHRVLGCDYLAGLWRYTLLQDLTWYAFDRDKDRPVEYRAPSWSWAAVDGQIISVPYRPPEIVFGAQVMRCHVTLKDPEFLFGEVTGGSLVLRAKLIPCNVRKAEHGKSGAEIWGSSLPRGQPCSGGSHHADGYTTAIAEDEQCCLAEGLDCMVDHCSDLLFKRESDWLLPVWWKADRPQVDYSGWLLTVAGGLILTLANPDSGSETHNSKVYRRIGMFKLDRQGWTRLKHYYALEDEEEVEIV